MLHWFSLPPVYHYWQIPNNFKHTNCITDHTNRYNHEAQIKWKGDEYSTRHPLHHHLRHPYPSSSSSSWHDQHGHHQMANEGQSQCVSANPNGRWSWGCSPTACGHYKYKENKNKQTPLRKSFDQGKELSRVKFAHRVESVYPELDVRRGVLQATTPVAIKR